jgi:hypothetical protein
MLENWKNSKLIKRDEGALIFTNVVRVLDGL